MRILIVNGVNLEQLGHREVNIYGTVTFDDYLSKLSAKFPSVQFDFFQSDEEGLIANRIANALGYDGIILNAGAYTHSSMVLADAVRTISCPVIEVHISNLFGRENYRKNSTLASCCAGFISGFGLDSYRLAVEALL